MKNNYGENFTSHTIEIQNSRVAHFYYQNIKLSDS